MDLRTKLAILADAAKYDASCASSGSKRAAARGGLGSSEGMGICHSYTPDGRCVSLLKILLTNVCVYDCRYCINRVSSDVRRARFTPAEVVQLTVDLYRRNYIEGLFLSSGVPATPDATMGELAEVARALREDHKFRGYIHLKAVPGASNEALEAAGRHADRLSVNVELPTAADLVELAPEKTRAAIEEVMSDIRVHVDEAREERSKASDAPRFAPAGQTTQMIVGATPTPDGQILRTASQLYAKHALRRVYYSAYSPIPHADGRLPFRSPPLVREHRLYQADWLSRFYGFDVEEIVAPDASLDLELDPKLAWALAHRERFPIDVNRADESELLRVPGFGVRGVQRILDARRHRRLRLADLAKLGVVAKRARAFVVAADHDRRALEASVSALRRELAGARERQLSLFDEPRAGTSAT